MSLKDMAPGDLLHNVSNPRSTQARVADHGKQLEKLKKYPPNPGTSGSGPLPTPQIQSTELMGAGSRIKVTLPLDLVTSVRGFLRYRLRVTVDGTHTELNGPQRGEGDPTTMYVPVTPGTGSSDYRIQAQLVSSILGSSSWSEPVTVGMSGSSGGAWLVGGNNLSSFGVFGTLTEQDIYFYVNGREFLDMYAQDGTMFQWAVPAEAWGGTAFDCYAEQTVCDGSGTTYGLFGEANLDAPSGSHYQLIGSYGTAYGSSAADVGFLKGVAGACSMYNGGTANEAMAVYGGPIIVFGGSTIEKAYSIYGEAQGNGSVENWSGYFKGDIGFEGKAAIRKLIISPTTPPPDGWVYIYCKEDGGGTTKLYWMDDAGVEHEVGGGGGGTIKIQSVMSIPAPSSPLNELDVVDCTITGWKLKADAVGSVTVDVQVNGSSIGTISLSSAQSATGDATAFSSTALVDGDEVQFIPSSASGITALRCVLVASR